MPCKIWYIFEDSDLWKLSISLFQKTILYIYTWIDICTLIINKCTLINLLKKKKDFIGIKKQVTVENDYW